MLLLTVDEAAELLRVNRQTIYRAVKSGQLPDRRLCKRGGSYRFTLEDLHLGRGRPPEGEEADGGLVTEEGE